MEKTLSKSEAQEIIKFFFQKDNFTSEEMRKTKRRAMKYRISLKQYKQKFCKSCLFPLKGKVRITKTHKTIECANPECRFKNKFRVK